MAAQNILFQRHRVLANFENAAKTLEKARAKNKDVQQAGKALCFLVHSCVYHKVTIRILVATLVGLIYSNRIIAGH